MTYKLFIRRKAQKQLSKIPAKDYHKIKQAIFNLAKNPRPHNCEKLKGREGWKFRYGNYRVVYEIEDKLLIVCVIKIGHRKDVYRH